MSARSLRDGVFLAVLLAAAVVRVFAPPETDIAWLLTVCEKWLDGAGLYAGIVETNPPGAVLLYMPAVLLARLSGWAPESMVALFTFLGASASLWLSWRIVRPPEQAWPAAAFALGLLLILPAYAFGQRDHAALIFMLPILACYTARAQAKPVATGLALVAGMGGGLALCLRPHYVLALAPALAFAIWRSGRRGVATPENVAMLATGLGYGALVWFAFPAYVRDVMPLVAAVYMPVHRPWGLVLGNPSVFIGLLALFGTIACVRKWPVPIAIAALAGIGALAAMVLQGKGWPYHGYPAMALLLFALGCASEASSRRKAGLVLLAALLGASCIWLGTRRDTDAVAAAVARLTLPHPKVITISPDIALGQPLTRMVKGNWVGTSWGQWVSAGAAALAPREPEQRDRLLAWAARERQNLADDIRQKQPDVVLIEEGDWHRWAFKDHAIAGTLDAYRRAETVSGVEIWLRAKP